MDEHAFPPTGFVVAGSAVRYTTKLHCRLVAYARVGLLNFKMNLFELILYVPVNSNGHVGTLILFYGTFTQLQDVMAHKMRFKDITI